MCGIVAVLRRPCSRRPPEAEAVLADLDEAVAELSRWDERALASRPAVLRGVAARLDAVTTALAGTAGLACLLGTAGVLDQVAARGDALLAAADRVEAAADREPASVPPAAVEDLNAALVAVKDAAWALRYDRVGVALGVADLAGLDPGRQPDAAAVARPALDAWWSIEVALRAIDRLEVRGRDSAGLHVLVSGHRLDDERLVALLGERAADRLFTTMAARTPAGQLSLVYKAAAEVGELGDNVRALRAAIRRDRALAEALRSPDVAVTVLGHTRWASVGVISEANAHPLNSEEGAGAPPGPYVTAALNGDIDNHADLRRSHQLDLPPEVTTDAKVIPTLMSRQMASGDPAATAFRRTVAQFSGSAGIAASAADAPDELHLALRGSGQGLFVGLAEDAFVVASEVYGLVEETNRYLRMEGEATGGQTLSLRRDGAGSLEGVTSMRYDGRPIPLEERDVRIAEITTRDIDRRQFPHFLLKEITEAPQSFRKTLRGRLDASGVRLGEDTVPPALVAALAGGGISRVVVIGQGTAAVAGQGVAAAIARCLPGVPVTAQPATELSGFGLSDDMSDLLVVAISQSGTTTDTNRTVDLVRARGAHVVAIVNRRHSDLAERSDGVLYTSDGRDVEMSVASTKAFYAQIAAGWLLAAGLAGAAGIGGLPARLVEGLRALPDAMEAVLSEREHIAAIACRTAPSRRHWAVVGSGPDRVAAAEIRIKLSELCYKAIACDATEDKKHIDLSSEPLILVCASSLSGPNADDVAKEVAIYRAHQGTPVVIATGTAAERFREWAEVIPVPDCEPELAFVLAAMAGHLFGYEAALAIDAQARPLREARAIIQAAAGTSLADEAAGTPAGGDGAAGDGSSPEAGGPTGPGLLDQLGPRLAATSAAFLTALRRGDCDGSLDARTAVRLASLVRYATGAAPLEGYELEFGAVATPSAVIGDLLAALTEAIDQLTRPVDAIKHQAKTVTVGISRSEDALLGVPLVRATLEIGTAADQLGYRALRALAALDPAVEEVLGYTRYRIDLLAAADGSPPEPTITVVDQGGIALRLPPSRTATDPRLRGSKHRAVDEREVTVVRGRSDGRTVILVPETKGAQPVGMTLLHVRFAEFLPADAARAVLSGYRGRYSALADAVTETEPTFDDARLAEVPVVDLLTSPVYVLAERWRPAPPPGAAASPADGRVSPPDGSSTR